MPKLSSAQRGAATRKRRKRQMQSTWEHRAEVAKRVMQRRESQQRSSGKYKVAHDFSHNNRVGTNARKLILLLGGTQAQTHQAYIGGATHDIVRKNTNLVEHEIAGSKVLQSAMTKRTGKKGSKSVVRAVASHSRFPKAGAGVVQRAVFFADTTEKLHCYSIFRRAAFQAVKPENMKKVAVYIAAQKKKLGSWSKLPKTKHAQLLKKWESEMALFFVEDRTNVMIRKYGDLSKFPKAIRGKIGRQINLQKQFLKALDAGERWAQKMSLDLYWAGKEGREVDVVLRSFRPTRGSSAEKFKAEALKFVDGKFYG
jgi:HD superfamily phosphohydrolase YqeK